MILSHVQSTLETTTYSFFQAGSDSKQLPRNRRRCSAWQIKPS
jgi:hypothetical protein